MCGGGVTCGSRSNFPLVVDRDVCSLDEHARELSELICMIKQVRNVVVNVDPHTMKRFAEKTACDLPS